MICKTIFGVGKAVVFYSGFCVSKVISEKKSKVIYAGDLIKKQLYYPKGGPGGELLIIAFKIMRLVTFI